jgi:hypothetical protein
MTLETQMIAAHALRKLTGEYNVPCNGCVLCCVSDAVRILPHEDQAKWVTEPHQNGSGARMLAHKADGTCHYLGKTGCTTHDDKPQQCMEMDCRRLAANISWTRARKLSAKGLIPIQVYTRGRALRAQLKP